MTPEVASSTRRVTAVAPAKLNLTLAVVGRRADGFHDLHSIFVPLGFGDEIELVVDETGATDLLAIEGSDDLSAGPDNLILRAVAATRAALVAAGTKPADLPNLAIRLTKRIPIAAGLGGGSSDAAATIGAALRAWNATLPEAALSGLAATLGSDVPFFLAGGPALVTGRGEFVEPLPKIRGAAPAVLIVTPRVPVATPAVFAAYAGGARPAAREAALSTSERLAADWRGGLTGPQLLERAADLAAANDLLPAAMSVAPDLEPFRGALARLLARPVGLSGSGPTSWILFETEDEALQAAATVNAATAEGRLPTIASGEPFVAAAAIGLASPQNGLIHTPKGR